MTMSGANSIPERVVGVRPASVKNGLSPRSQPRFSRPLIRPAATFSHGEKDCARQRACAGLVEMRNFWQTLKLHGAHVGGHSYQSAESVASLIKLDAIHNDSRIDDGTAR